VPLEKVLDPIGVKRVEGNVTNIDFSAHEIAVETDSEKTALPYDRLVLAAGSRLNRPDIPGLREYAHAIDTHAEAEALADHLGGLSSRSASPGQYTAVVVGAGLTGVEAACELPDRLKSAGGGDQEVRVILVDRSKHVGSTMGKHARPVIEEALSSLGIETRLDVSVESITPEGVTLSSGEEIPALTTVWTAGMRASALTELFPVIRDSMGRVTVDEFLRVKGMQDVFAAGDLARAMPDDGHLSVMSCQHARPQGRIAGHNVAADLLGKELIAYRQEAYVTCLDLGPWGAVYTKGWDRQVFNKGAAAKETKQTINCIRIYPPLSGDRQEILDEAAPVIQAVPATKVK
jgi:NADH dehydrogenase